MTRRVMSLVWPSMRSRYLAGSVFQLLNLELDGVGKVVDVVGDLRSP
ncbi:MAG: hypothetical protein ACLPXZ_30320 [Mycobacterium sp.]